MCVENVSLEFYIVGESKYYLSDEFMNYMNRKGEILWERSLEA